MAKTKGPCVVCGAIDILRRRMCSRHYMQAWARGERVPVLSVEERFRSKYVVAENGCWLWQAALFSDGYAVFFADRRQMRAHRWAYERFIGPIPDGLVLDHFVCDTRSCVNPDHVRPVTHRENLLRGDTLQAWNLARDTCIHGHAFDEANTYVTRQGQRMCRRCVRDRMRRVRAQKKVA